MKTRLVLNLTGWVLFALLGSWVAQILFSSPLAMLLGGLIGFLLIPVILAVLRVGFDWSLAKIASKR